MTPNDTISITLLLSFASIVIALLGIANTYRKQHKEEVTEREKAVEAENQRQLKMQENFVKVNVKLDSFCDTTKDIMKQSEKSGDAIAELTKQMIRNGEQLKTLFTRTEEHERRIADLEKRK